MRWGAYQGGLAGVACIALTAAGVGGPVSNTAFTFQGQLKRDGVPVTDECVAELYLYEAASGGDPLISYFVNLEVVDGLFAVQPDFGAEFFDGSLRYLEVYVECGGAGAILSPRQKITPAPQALYSQQTRGVSVSDSGGVGIGTTEPLGLLDVRGPIWVQGSPGQNDSSNIVMTKAGAVGPDNVQFALSHRMSGDTLLMFGFDGVVFRNFQSWDNTENAVEFPPGGANLHLDLGSGRTGMGTTSPRAKLTISRPTQSAAYQLELRNVGSIQAPNYDGIVFTQGADGGTELGSMKLHYRNTGRPDLSLGVRERPDAFLIHGNYNGRGGNVGIGTTDPEARLHVAGNLKVDGSITVASTTRYLMIGASDMVPQSSSLAVYRSFASIVSFFAPAGQVTTLYAPVHLPDGATVTELRGFLSDNVPDDDVFVQLEAEGRGGGMLILGTIFTQGEPGLIEAVDDTIQDAVIDNSAYSYYVRVVYTVPPVDGERHFRISPVRIAYQVTSPLP